MMVGIFLCHLLMLTHCHLMRHWFVCSWLKPLSSRQFSVAKSLLRSFHPPVPLLLSRMSFASRNLCLIIEFIATYHNLESLSRLIAPHISKIFPNYAPKRLHFCTFYSMKNSFCSLSKSKTSYQCYVHTMLGTPNQATHNYCTDIWASYIAFQDHLFC